MVSRKPEAHNRSRRADRCCSTFLSPLGWVWVVSGAEGLVRLDLPADERPCSDELPPPGQPARGGTEPHPGEPLHLRAVAAIRAYLEGQDVDLSSLPRQPSGTRFQRAVWAELQRIPRGQVLSYAKVAERIGRSGAARAVGSACHANPFPLVVPCHRVVASGGGLGGFRGGLALKQALLELEAGEIC